MLIVKHSGKSLLSNYQKFENYQFFGPCGHTSVIFFGSHQQSLIRTKFRKMQCFM